jgi:hypothetical protein
MIVTRAARRSGSQGRDTAGTLSINGSVMIVEANRTTFPLTVDNRPKDLIQGRLP